MKYLLNSPLFSALFALIGLLTFSYNPEYQNAPAVYFFVTLYIFFTYSTAYFTLKRLRAFQGEVQE